MSNYSVYMDTPNGERIELPVTVRDITEADDILWDGNFELP